MTDRDDTPAQDSTPAEPDPVSEVVRQYAFLAEDDPDLDLELFLEGHPAELRDEIRRHCKDTQRVLDVLRRRSTGPLQTAALPERIGEFKIEGELGRGGMGIVYLAWQESLQRRVALKVLGINPGVTTRAIQRFQREATTAGKLRHPGIVQVFSVGEDGGALWIAMEYIEGETLSTWLAQRTNTSPQPTSDEGRDIATSAELIAQMADALEYAHGQGIIHRDLKPANVLIDSGGRARLVDFGLAKDLGELSISQSGDIAGTPHYMSPEQAAAQRARIDHRSDVFSLGVILYECLTHKRPFEGDSVQRILFEISFKEARPARTLRPSCPRDLATICHKALEKNPERRFQSAAELAAELRRFLNHESILSRPPSLPGRLLRFAARHRGASICAALLVIAAALSPVVAGRVAHAARRDEALKPVRELATYADIASAPTQLVLTAYESGTMVLEADDSLSADDERDTREQLERIDSYRDVLAARGLASMQSAYDPIFRSDSESRIVPFMAGLRSVVISTFLSPERSGRAGSALEVLLDARPTLSVTCDAAGAEVSLITLDRFDGTPGQPTALGRTPLVEAFFDPGYYRIVVSKPGVGFAEMTRLLDEPARAHTLHARLREAEDLASEGMVLIDDGAAPFVFGFSPSGPYRERRATVAPFWIAEKEVSNAEYRAFLADTGRAAPKFWPEPWDPALDDRPVSGVNWFDAQAYAEWAGMRLPTMFEWQRAARGRDGAQIPRPLAQFAPDAYAVGAPTDYSNVRSTQDLEAAFRQSYMEHSRPVDSNPELRGPEGLYHAFGNVAEWTETLMTQLDWQGVQFTKTHARAIQGFGFSDPPSPIGMVRVHEMDSATKDPKLGIRCAKSARVR